MSGTLPWMDCLTNAKAVHAQKKTYMNDIAAFLEHCFGHSDHPAELQDFLSYVSTLSFESAPDYDRCRNFFRNGMKKRKIALDGKLDFAAPKTPAKKGRLSKHKKSSQRKTPAASPSISSFGTESGAITRSGENEELNGWCWESVLCSDPEMLIRQASRQSENEDNLSPLALQHKQLEARRQEESLKNPTDAMLEILKRIEEREKERQSMSWQQQLQQLTGKKINRNISWDLTPNPLTPAMEDVIQMRSKRVSFDYDIPITPDPSDDSDDSASDSSHEEYVPSSCRKKISPRQKDTSQRSLPSRSLSSPVRRPGSLEAELASLDDELKDVMLNESILKFLKQDGGSIAEQQQELRRYSRNNLATKRHDSCGQNKERVEKPTAYGLSNPGRARRISIQNEVSPIRNKDSPPDQAGPSKTVSKKCGKGSGEKWIVNGDHNCFSAPQPQTVSETVGTTSSASKGKAKRVVTKKQDPEKAFKASKEPHGTTEAEMRVTRSGVKRTSPDPDVKDVANFIEGYDDEEDEDICFGERYRQLFAHKKSKFDIEEADVYVRRPAQRRRKRSSNQQNDLDLCDEEAVRNSSATATRVPKAKNKCSSHEAKRKKATYNRSATRRIRSRCDTQAWNWGEILMTNPEDIIRRKNLD